MRTTLRRTVIEFTAGCGTDTFIYRNERGEQTRISFPFADPSSGLNVYAVSYLMAYLGTLCHPLSQTKDKRL